jgi:fluoroacetyl-CoA thioesterase
MKDLFKAGDKKYYRKVVADSDVASFDGELVHPVYATFSLARDAEWAGRQFVLEMKDEDEEGIGTFLSIEHKNPAFVGEEVIFTAIVERLTGNELICSFEAHVEGRLIASGKTAQKILPRKKLNQLFSRH